MQSHPAGHVYATKQVDYPGVTATALENGATGQWSDPSEDTHAFFYGFKNNKGPFFDLDPKDGSTSQQAWQMNDHGLVALSTNIGKSYIYCPRHHPEKCPSNALPTKQGPLSGTANSARP